MKSTFTKSLLFSATALAIVLVPVSSQISAAPANQSIRLSPPAGAPMSFADLVEKVSPAVVSISVTDDVDDDINVEEEDGEDSDSLSRRFEFFFPPGSPFSDSPFDGRQFSMPRRRTPRQGSGSGFFISADGLLVTNNHVIKGADKITIRMDDDKEYKAKVIGTDEQTDLALLKVDGGKKKFSYVKLTKKSDYRVGDWVVAIGNPFRLGGTATAGIISANGRKNIGGPYTDFIQIDAPINPGNSGGPLFDLQGNVIGVNTAIFSRSGGNIGIGFAIPSDLAVNIIDDLRDDGTVERGWLGVVIASLDEDQAQALGLDDTAGALVNSVNGGSPAKKAGFRAGDVILSLDGKKIEDSIELTRLVGRLRPNSNAVFKVLREDGKKKTLRVKIAKRPSEKDLTRLARGETPLPEEKSPATENVEKAEIDVLGLDVRLLKDSEKPDYDLDSDDSAVVITKVDLSSEAAAKGLSRGMVIKKVNGKPVDDLTTLKSAIKSAKNTGRNAVMLMVQTRDGDKRYVGLPVKKTG